MTIRDMNSLTSLSRFFALLLSCALFNAAHAEQVTIEVTGVGSNVFPIAIAPLLGEASLKEAISPIIRADLERSGRFRLVDAPIALPDAPPTNLPEWKAKGAISLSVGSAQLEANGNSRIRLRLYDTEKQNLIDGLEIIARPGELRRAAHQLADMIYERITGDKGVFSTKIAYVVKTGTRYEVHVADADGVGGQMVFGTNDPIMSPAWSPDGRRLAYVSFERKKAVVFVQDLLTGSRKAVAAFKGSNSAPAWSADGQSLAVTLTIDGISQIYRVRADGSGDPQRLTRSASIDTEPCFSPDGQTIAFTSDRGGSPQIYTVPAVGGEPQRLTFEGSYNVSPQYSPDGKTLAYVARNNGNFQIAVLDIASKRLLNTLTDGHSDESPSFAPNGRMLLYATELGGRGVLAAVSSDGTVKQKLSTQGDAREPVWGPFAQPLPAIPMIPGLNK